MGQKIELKTTKFNKNVIFDLNRSLSGQMELLTIILHKLL